MLVKISKYEQKISNVDKLFWPQERIYKGDLIKYYLEMSSLILPHLVNRPMVMKRYPDGITGKAFYQKQCPAFTPSWIKTFRIDDKQMILVNDVDTLIWLINLGCIELHPWLSTIENLSKPDIIVFDLDPEPPASFRDTLNVALLIKEIINAANLKCYPKTSGSEGLHIYIPVRPYYTFEIVKETLKILCHYIEEKYPKLVTTDLKKNKRKGKVYLDFLQNGYGKTMASVYSVRPVKGALVSTPLTWSEIKQGVDNNKYNIFNLKSRIEQVKGDIFSEVNGASQDFSPLVKTLNVGKSRKI